MSMVSTGAIDAAGRVPHTPTANTDLMRPVLQRLLPPVLVAMCALGAIVNFGMSIRGAGSYGVDFNQFYSAGRLAGTGRLYDQAALRQLEAAHGPHVFCGRLPVVAYGMKLVTWLPFFTARTLWFAASVAALLAAGLLWPGLERRTLWTAIAWSVPAGYVLVLGQDTSFWLAFFAAGLWLLERDHPRWAGIAFALCICKFHLAVGIPILLVSRKLWQTLAAGAIAMLVLVAACFPIEGLSWPRHYLAVIGSPDFSIAFGRMPNLHGLAWWLPASGLVEAAGAVALAFVLWRFCAHTTSVGIAGAATAAAGLLLGHHGYFNDCVLLIPLAVAVVLRRTAAPRWLRFAAALVLTPVVPMFLSSPHPLPGQLLVVGFVFSALLLE
jgi:hypothetical protein